MSDIQLIFFTLSKLSKGVCCTPVHKVNSIGRYSWKWMRNKYSQLIISLFAVVFYRLSNLADCFSGSLNLACSISQKFYPCSSFFKTCSDFVLTRDCSWWLCGFAVAACVGRSTWLVFTGVGSTTSGEMVSKVSWCLHARVRPTAAASRLFSRKLMESQSNMLCACCCTLSKLSKGVFAALQYTRLPYNAVYTVQVPCHQGTVWVVWYKSLLTLILILLTRGDHDLLLSKVKPRTSNVSFPEITYTFITRGIVSISLFADGDCFCRLRHER